MINNREYIRGFFLMSIILCMCFISSCTYDYFEDETNYVVYAPKADQNRMTDTYKVDDVKILIYDNAVLERERFSTSPFEDNARTRVGNFHFKLLPGLHHVYSFSKTKELDFVNVNSRQLSSFSLRKQKDGFYNEPPTLLVETHKPAIQFPGPALADTAWFERRYVGRICVAFKNLQQLDAKLTLDNIKKVEVAASGVGTMQYLSQITDSINTRSSRNSANDMMKLTASLLKSPYTGFDFGFENYYFPSIGKPTANIQEEAISLALNFKDEKNNTIYSLNVDVVDAKNGYEPIILHMNETLLVTVDGNNVQVLRLNDLLDWNSDVQLGDDSTPGGGVEI